MYTKAKLTNSRFTKAFAVVMITVYAIIAIAALLTASTITTKAQGIYYDVGILPTYGDTVTRVNPIPKHQSNLKAAIEQNSLSDRLDYSFCGKAFVYLGQHGEFTYLKVIGDSCANNIKVRCIDGWIAVGR